MAKLFDLVSFIHSHVCVMGVGKIREKYQSGAYAAQVGSAPTFFSISTNFGKSRQGKKGGKNLGSMSRRRGKIILY